MFDKFKSAVDKYKIDMILQRLEYSEFSGQPQEWRLEEFSLEKVNLLVGKNATGKTHTISAISWLSNMLCGIQPQLLQSGNYNAEFSDKDGVYRYTLTIDQHKVTKEVLLINSEEKVQRNDKGIGKIFAEKLGIKGECIDFQVPESQLVVLSRRDKLQHPYLDKLYQWAAGVRLYEFGKELGKNTGFTASDLNTVQVNPRDTNNVALLFAKGKKSFGDNFCNSIISQMDTIGYNLKSIDIKPTPIFIMPTAPLQVLCVEEKGVKSIIPQQNMSQGMFRALSLIIQIEYNRRESQSTTLLIDDIGEGLDFDRASGIIQLITNAVKDNDMQVIMSSNDRFVMNSVPLRNWQVIQRNGYVCNILNYSNSKEKFDEFEFTGLSNFSFLSTDFLNQEITTER